MTDAPATEPTGGEQPAARTVEEALAVLDRQWSRFRTLAFGYPAERMDEPLEKGWTRKQMLAHIAAWHESATERLARFLRTGRPEPLTTTVDARNAQVARVAIGRTSGEILHSLDATYGRLRRSVGQLTDEQLQTSDGWAAELIADNCYRHYAEHAPALAPPAAEQA